MQIRSLLITIRLMRFEVCCNLLQLLFDVFIRHSLPNVITLLPHVKSFLLYTLTVLLQDNLDLVSLLMRLLLPLREFVRVRAARRAVAPQ